MMKSKFLLFLLLGFLSVKGQDGYSVLYRHYPLTPNERKPAVVKNRLVFADTLSFWYGLPDNGKDLMRKDTIFGKKLWHHAVLFNSNSRTYYSEVSFPKNQPEYLITDALEDNEWVIFDQYKEILGYKCRAALSVNKNNDSTLVWFTDSIPKPFGPFFYMGLGGLVLEVYDQVRSRHLVAVEINRGNYYVVMPERGALISPEDFRKLKR